MMEALETRTLLSGYAAQTLATFDGTNGFKPSGLFMASDGNLYGTTINGGYGDGTVFEIAKSTGILSTLATITGVQGGVVVDNNGDVYGVDGDGVFEIVRGSGTATTVPDPNYYTSGTAFGLGIDSSGNVYGCGNAIFEIPSGTNTITDLAQSNVYAEGRPLVDANGNIFFLGDDLGQGENGIFEMAKGTGAVSFLAPVQANVENGNLVEDGDGNLYGVTLAGGAYGLGSIFELANGASTVTTLASFTHASGGTPYDAVNGLVMDEAGNLFGATVGESSGPPAQLQVNDYGAVFELAKGSASITPLWAPGNDEVAWSLVSDGTGDIYGVATPYQSQTGLPRYGNLFELTPDPSPAAPAEMVFVQEPEGYVATNGCLAPAIKLEIVDQSFNVVATDTSTVKLSILSGPVGGVLNGPASVSAVDSVATFSGLSLSVNGSYILQATDTADGLTAISCPFALYNNKRAFGSQLAFTQQPTVAIAGAPLGTVAVSLEDQNCQVLTNWNGTVYISLQNGPFGGVLGGTTSATIVGGTATFNSLTFSTPGAYILSAMGGSGLPFMVSSMAITVTALSPPTLLSPGTNASPGQVISSPTPTFQWQGVSFADQYGLYISQLQSNGTYSLIFDSTALGITLPGSTTSYTLPAGVLVDGGQYRWNMNSHNAAGWGSYSAREYFTYTTSAAPAAPVVTASAMDATTVHLSWDPVRGATVYLVYRSGLASGPWAEVQQLAEAQWDDLLVSPGTAYYYEVEAYGPGGGSPPSAVVSAHTLTAAVPPTPTGLSVESASTSLVSLLWNDTLSAGQYVLQRSSDGTDFKTIADIPAGQGCVYDDPQIPMPLPQMTYEYRLLSELNGVFSTGWSSASATISANVQAVTLVPQLNLPPALQPYESVPTIYRLDVDQSLSTDSAMPVWDPVTNLSTLSSIAGFSWSDPTVILTHGWNDKFVPGDDGSYINVFAERLLESGQAAADDMNVFAIDWSGVGSGAAQQYCATPDGVSVGTDVLEALALLAGGAAPLAGIPVAQALADANNSANNAEQIGIVLGDEFMAAGLDPSRTMLVGHSNGAALMATLAITAKAKGEPIEELVSLDAPTWTSSYDYVAWAAQDGAAQQVDNYYMPLSAAGFGAEMDLPNVINYKMFAAPSFNIPTPWGSATEVIGHLAVPLLWANTAEETASSVNPWGFEVSPFMTGSSWMFPPGTAWVESSPGVFTMTLTQSQVAALPQQGISGVSAYLGFQEISLWDAVSKGVVGTGVSAVAGDTWSYIVAGVQSLGPVPMSDAGVLPLDASQDSIEASIDVTVPTMAMMVGFDLTVTDAGNNDTLLVAIGDTVIDQIDLASQELTGGHIDIPIADYAGQATTLNFYLPSDVPTSAQFTIGNLAFAVLPFPGKTVGVAAGDGTDPDGVQVGWAAVDGATGYDVWRSTSNDSGTAVQLNSTDIAGTTFDDTTAAPGTVYWYWVVAKNAAGSGAFSDPDSGYEAPTVPGAFTFDTAGNSDSYYLKIDPTGNYLQISFASAPLDVPSYQIALAQLTSLNLNLLGTSNTVDVDFSGGSPVPTGNITIACDATAQDELEVIGAAPSQVFTMSDTQIGLANGPGIVFQNLDTLAVSNLVVYYSGTLSTIQNLDIDAGTTFAWGSFDPPQNDDGSDASNQAPVNVASNDPPAIPAPVPPSPVVPEVPASPPADTSNTRTPIVAAPEMKVAAWPSVAAATPASHLRVGTSKSVFIAFPTIYKHPQKLPPLTRGTSWHGDRTAHVVQKIDPEDGEQISASDSSE